MFMYTLEVSSLHFPSYLFGVTRALTPGCDGCDPLQFMLTLTIIKPGLTWRMDIMSIKGLERAFWQAAGDGWINWQEAHQIERAALENDNTVNAQEKKFLQDHYRPGF